MFAVVSIFPLIYVVSIHNRSCWQGAKKKGLGIPQREDNSLKLAVYDWGPRRRGSRAPWGRGEKSTMKTPRCNPEYQVLRPVVVNCQS